MRALRTFAAAAALILAATQAAALPVSQAPSPFPIPWANSAGPSYIRAIPVGSQIGVQNGAASLTDGFPPLNFTPISAGGVPPFGQDMNGVFNQITANLRWMAAGEPATWSSAYSTAIGGYPLGAIVQSATTPGTFWRSTADNNTNNPDTGGPGWAAWNFVPAVGGNAATASALQTSRSISATGDATWSVNFSGSANVTAALTLATVNANTGAFGSASSLSVPSVTLNAKGQVTAASAATLPAYGGDSGSGGTAGVVPAPPSGSAAQNRYLGADGAWDTPPLKAWASITGSSGAIRNGFNVQTVTHTGTGQLSIAFNNNLSNSNYAAFITVQAPSGGNDTVCTMDNGSKSVSGFNVTCAVGNATEPGGKRDPAELYIQVLD